MGSRKRDLAMAFGLALMSAAACQSTVSPSPSTVDARPSGSAEIARPSRPSGEPVNLFDTTYAPEAGTDGGQIVVGDHTEPNQFNPLYVAEVTEANVASAAWATLVVATHDYKYAPDLAVDIPTLDNGGVAVPGEGADAMTVTWQLKPDLRWSDGRPLTCDDFRYTWEWVLDPDNVGVVTAGWDDVADWECRSPTQMVLHFDAVFEGYITLAIAPLPRHYLEAIPVADQVKGAGFRAEEMAQVPTSGAFRFESVTPGQELRLVRNEHYRSFGGDAPAHLETIVFKWYGDAEAEMGGYRGGEIDLALGLADGDLPKVQDLGDEVRSIPSLTYEFLRLNGADGTNVREDGVGGCSRSPDVADRGEGCPMADPAMRRALAHAIDKEEIRSRVLGGTVEVANSPISPEAWYFVEQPATRHDPARARSILEQAGWMDPDGDGVREKDGLRAKIELCTTPTPARLNTLALVVAWLADIGVESFVHPVDARVMFSGYNESTVDTPCALSHGNFDVAMHFFSSSIDPLGNYLTYHSGQFEPIGGNDAHVAHPDFDAALDTVVSSVDFAVVRDAMADFQRVFTEQTVEVPLYYVQHVALVRPVVGNFVPNPTQAGPTWNAADWYLKR